MPSGSPSNQILLVDDDKDITDTLKLGLRQHGYQIDAFNDPIEALSELTPGKYDLAILDFRMPNMNGFELYREIKKIDRGIGICFFTAFDMANDEFGKLFPTIEAQDFLKKPMGISEVAVRIDRMLNRAKQD